MADAETPSAALAILSVTPATLPDTLSATCGTAGQCLGHTSEAFNGAGRRFGDILRGGRGGIADRSQVDRQPGYLVPR